MSSENYNGDDSNGNNDRKISRKDFIKLSAALGIYLGIGSLGLRNFFDNLKPIYAQPGKEHLIPDEELETLDRLIKKGNREEAGTGNDARSLTQGKNPHRFLIFTWNAHYFTDWRCEDCAPQNFTLNRVVTYLERAKPDIVFFQELYHKDRNITNDSALSFIINNLSLKGQTYYYAAAKDPRGKWGAAAHGILSKYPLRNTKTHPIEVGEISTPLNRDPPSILETVLDLPKNVTRGPITLLSTHFFPGEPRRPTRINGAKLAVKLLNNDISGPVIFGGDFNAKPHTPEMQIIYKNTKIYDSFLKANVIQLPPPRAPNEEPPDDIQEHRLERIDYIFCRGGNRRDFKVLGYEIDDQSNIEGLTDHKVLKIALEETWW